MKIVKSLSLAAVISAASLSANAATLVFDFSGTLSVAFDPAYHSPEVISDLSETFTEVPRFTTFSGQLVLPSFENYLSGSHEISLNSSGLQLSLYTGLFGGLEGTKTPVLGGVPPRVVGSVFRPDSTQDGDWGKLSITNGNVTGFSWTAGAGNPIVDRINNGIISNFAWPTQLGEIAVSLNGASASYQIGDVYLASNRSGVTNVTMVPEADSYAMFLAGLGIIGAIVRRRRAAK